MIPHQSPALLPDCLIHHLSYSHVVQAFLSTPSSVIRLMTYSSDLELPQTWHTDDSTAEGYFRMLTGAIL